MRNAIFCFGVLMGPLVYGCPDISGKYHDLNTSDPSIFEFKQVGCEKIEFIRYDDNSTTPSNQTEWKTDGVPREIFDANTPDMIYSAQIQFIDDKLVFLFGAFNVKTEHYEHFSRSEMTMENSGTVLKEQFT